MYFILGLLALVETISAEKENVKGTFEIAMGRDMKPRIRGATVMSLDLEKASGHYHHWGMSERRNGVLGLV